LEVLQKRQEATSIVFEEASKKLFDISKGAKYGELMFNLILQGLYRLMEDKVVLSVLEKDYSLVEEILPKISEKYKTETKKTVTIVIDKSQPLASTRYHSTNSVLEEYYWDLPLGIANVITR
jgi:vacuolar-type H+-ATPase subunit E/Vma4